MKSILIHITTKASYLPDQSAIGTQQYIWSYEISIKNESDEIVQLLNRYWRIVDWTGHVEEVKGPGVVGMQPIIKPQKKFIYNSFCQLPTPQGSMEGHYEMQTLEEEHFIVPIPKFELTAPTEISVNYRSRLH